MLTQPTPTNPMANLILAHACPYCNAPVRERIGQMPGAVQVHFECGTSVSRESTGRLKWKLRQACLDEVDADSDNSRLSQVRWPAGPEGLMLDVPLGDLAFCSECHNRTALVDLSRFGMCGACEAEQA